MSKSKFRDFIWRVLNSSKLRIQSGALQKAFQDEIALNAEATQKYHKSMEDIWESWKELNTTDFISQFVQDLGSTLFLMWLSDVFPFDFNRLSAQCPQGPSLEEALVDIQYKFSSEELKIIKDVLIAHWMNESEEYVAQIMFIEAIKSISGVFSQIIQHPFKIYTSNVELIREYDTLKIHYSGAGRVER